MGHNWVIIRKPLPVLFALLALTTVLAGCHEPTHASCPTPSAQASRAYEDLGFDGTTWPRLDGQTVTVLDHGAFGAFDNAKARFEQLTGAKVQHVEADDSGSALNRAILEKGDPTFDVLYGVDNVLFCRALEENLFLPYKPLLAERIDPAYILFDADQAWPATPVDHGYVAVNWDPHHPDLRGATIEGLGQVGAHAQTFVTPDPRTSTPGLGYLLATIATYGEDGWKDHWRTLFNNGVLVTAGWSEAYEQHFSGGYGPAYGGLGDRAIVTSYTTSPAYEAYYGTPANETARVLTAAHSTFHQIETMGIVRGTKNLAAAQAWIEFTLTDMFQNLTSSDMAVYPVVRSQPGVDVFGGLDPAPDGLEPAGLDVVTIGQNVDRWVREWTDLCEAHDCA